ncbi:MAG: NFACT RNA binding domain-containing protein [Clostridia bacterium]|nr:NFACT RNA binding domain-containing protein [Clostridia bacterium]
MYKLDSGSVILVGRNNKENDILTLKYAKKDDVWLHIKDMPGSHTIISRSDNSPVSDDDLYKAACVAAYYSKAKNSGKAAVDYTCIRNVKKPKGAKPGMVIYVNYNTLYVKPEDLSQQI